MKRFILGVLVGLLLAGAAVWAGERPWWHLAQDLLPWKWEGTRPGLYYHRDPDLKRSPGFIFYECKRLGEARPAPPPR